MLKSRKFIATFIAVLVALGSAIFSSPANAVGFLISSNPSANQQLSTAPHSISLEFSVPSIPASLSGNVIRVTNSAGSPVEVGTATTTANSLSVDLRPNLEPDRYQVAYRYVCDDGHVLVSAFSFTVLKTSESAPANSASAPVATKSPSKPSPTSASAIPSPQVSSDQISPQTSATAEPQEEVSGTESDNNAGAGDSVGGQIKAGGQDGSGWMVAAAGTVLACVLVVFIWIRSRRRSETK